jgi:hypothetical protein
MSINKVILIGNLGKDPDVRRLWHTAYSGRQSSCGVRLDRSRESTSNYPTPAKIIFSPTSTGSQGGFQASRPPFGT